MHVLHKDRFNLVTSDWKLHHITFDSPHIKLEHTQAGAHDSVCLICSRYESSAMAGIFSYITVLLCVITVSEACKCAVIHPQTSFCIADFGMYNLRHEMLTKRIFSALLHVFSQNLH